MRWLQTQAHSGYRQAQWLEYLSRFPVHHCVCRELRESWRMSTDVWQCSLKPLTKPVLVHSDEAWSSTQLTYWFPHTNQAYRFCFAMIALTCHNHGKVAERRSGGKPALETSPKESASSTMSPSSQETAMCNSNPPRSSLKESPTLNSSAMQSELSLT